ncbi:MAG: hypothetical protein HYW45_02505 [Candidatus Daviesbacteria bacterium]|nr:MAG: hypothetical protein HYW45_02505 [Candidatus Daviesbacteria bacterium]
MKKLVLLLIFWAGWIVLVSQLFNPAPESNYPFLRTRLGTILHHSSDMNGVYLGAYLNPEAQDHIYCYYPKFAGHLIQRVSQLSDCQNFAGAVIIRESAWVSEDQKFWWSEKEQQIESKS